MFHRIEDRTPAGVDRPDVRRRALGQHLHEVGIGKRGADPAGHLARQMHGKAAVGDVPADQLGGAGKGSGKGALQRKAIRLGSDERGRCAVPELQHGKQRFQRVGSLQVQGGKLHRYHQHACLWLRSHDVAGASECRDRSITAHEPDEQPFHTGRQAKPGGDDLVDPWRDEAGAARHHQVRDRAERLAAGEIVDRGECQDRRRLGIDPHPLGRSGVGLRGVEAAGINRRSVRVRQHRPAMLNPRSRAHAIEQPALPLGQASTRPGDEGAMDVVPRHRRADHVEMGVHVRG